MLSDKRKQALYYWQMAPSYVICHISQLLASKNLTYDADMQSRMQSLLPSRPKKWQSTASNTQYDFSLLCTCHACVSSRVSFCPLILLLARAVLALPQPFCRVSEESTRNCDRNVWRKPRYVCAHVFGFAHDFAWGPPHSHDARDAALSNTPGWAHPHVAPKYVIILFVDIFLSFLTFIISFSLFC